MRKFLVILALIVLSFPAWASTTLRLHDSPSSIANCKSMDVSLGPFGGTPATGVTTTTATTNVQMTKTASGSTLAWCTEPIATASNPIGTGTITFNVYGGESATSNNMAFRAKLYYCASPCTSIGSLPANFALGEMATELTASNTTARNWTAGTVTPQAVSAGDRLVLILSVENCVTSSCPTAGNMSAVSSATTIHYDGATDAADGSSWVQTTENLTFTPNASGHCIVVGLTGDSGQTFTVTDDHSNVYNLGALKEDGNNEATAIYYATNVATGTKAVTVTPSSSTNYLQIELTEVANCAIGSALDVSTGAAASSTTVAAGSITPKSSNDFFYQWMWNTYNVATSSFTAGSQSNITWKLGSAFRVEGVGSQSGVYASTAAINPTMTIGTAGFNTTFVALKQGATGTIATVQRASYYGKGTGLAGTNYVGQFRTPTSTGDPPSSGVRVLSMTHFPYNTNGYTANPITVQFPCDGGNLMVDVFNSGGGGDISGITDSHSNSWTGTGTFVQANPGGGGAGVRTFYAANATTSTDQTLTITHNSVQHSDHVMYCLAGAATAPFDSAATGSSGTGTQTATGNQVTTANPQTLSTVSITPSTANGIVFFNVGVDFNTVASIATYNYDTCFWLGEDESGSGCDQNNGWASYDNPSASSLTAVWTMVHPNVAAGYWAARADAFKGISTGTTRKRVIVVTE